jgi:hypothetical protein
VPPEAGEDAVSALAEELEARLNLLTERVDGPG